MQPIQIGLHPGTGYAFFAFVKVDEPDTVVGI